MKNVYILICLFCSFFVIGCHKSIVGFHMGIIDRYKSIIGHYESKDIPTITAQELEGNFSCIFEKEDQAFWLRGFRNSDGKLVFKFIRNFYDCEPVFKKYSINGDQAQIVFKLIPYKQDKSSRGRLKVVLKKTDENLFQGQIFQPGKKRTIATFRKRHDYMNTAPFEGIWSHSFEFAGRKRNHILRCFRDDMGRPRFNFLRQYYSYEPVFTECSFSTVRPNQIEIKFKLTQYESGGDSKYSLKYILKSEDGVLVGKLYESWREPVDVTLVPYQNRADKEPLSTKVIVSAEDKTATIYSGTVTDLDGNAIEGAKLHILRHHRFRTVSDRQGEYEISWDVSKVPESHDIYIIARHEEKNLAAATKVRQDTHTQNITFLPAVTATGTITDLDGNPIENATVYFGFTAAKGYITSFADRRRFAADSRGIYKVPFIPPKNRYLVSFNAEGYGSKRISVNTDDAVDGVLELSAAALSKADQAISGVVVDPDGNPVPNVQIFRKSKGQPLGYKKTDADGRFTIAVCKGDVVLSAVIRKDGTMLVGRAKAVSGAKDVKIVLKPR